MSKQRRQDDGERDPVVTEAYRELAQERTPAHLDHVVLNEARREARAGRRRGISWLRPVAWVTTIGLCLAIVLEVTDPVSQDDTSVTSTPASGHKESRGDAPALLQKRADPQPISPERALSRDKDAASIADDPIPESFGLEAEEVVPSMPSQEPKNEGTIPVDIEPVGRGDSMMLQDVGERARTQEGAGSAQLKSMAKSMKFAEVESERYCDDQDTSTPDSWVECIIRLQQEGRHDEARLEHERLQETYPGADIPPLTSPLPDSP